MACLQEKASCLLSRARQNTKLAHTFPASNLGAPESGGFLVLLAIGLVYAVNCSVETEDIMTYSINQKTYWPIPSSREVS